MATPTHWNFVYFARVMCCQLANINGLLRLQVERRTAFVCIMTDTDAQGRWMGNYSD
jgi:hypothetical protein